jgi:hypothetical protein
MAETAKRALQKVENTLPTDFPPALHGSVSKGVKGRVDLLQIGIGAKGGGR